MIWSSFGKAFVIALVLTPVIRDIFRAYNVVDRPGVRKVHAYPIPRLGGIAVAVAYTAALVTLPVGRLPSLVLPPAAVLLVTGILDDFFNLPPAYKLLGQILSAGIAFAGGIRLAGPLLISLPLTMLWLLAATNAFNLVDGLDGLCAGLGFASGAILFAMAWIQGNVALESAVIPLAGSLLGFLCYNFSRATMFLGDSGALLVGFLLGCYGVIWTRGEPAGVHLVAPALALSVPLLDLGLSVIRRVAAHHPIFSADRRHVHHRLLDRGLSPMQAVLILYAWAISGGVFALLLGYPPLRPWWAVLLAGFVATVLFGVRQLRYSEF